MDTPIIVGIEIGIGILVHLLIVAYCWGKLRQEVTGHSGRILRLEDRADEFAQRISRLEGPQ